MLREESAQFFLADTLQIGVRGDFFVGKNAQCAIIKLGTYQFNLGNISNVEISIFDICSVGSTVRHLDPLVGHLFVSFVIFH